MGRADGDLIEITLSDTDPAILRMTLLYDPQENVLRENDVIYHWTASEDSHLSQTAPAELRLARRIKKRRKRKRNLRPVSYGHCAD